MSKAELINALPSVNATLNGLAAVLLLAGFIAIKRRKFRSHKYAMVSAFAMSVIFLATYVTYHTLRQMEEGVGHTKWQVEGWLQPTYYVVLITHVILAAFVPILAIWTVVLALRQKFAAHKKVARVTWPIWMYVSVTGVIVYLMLYHLQPRLLSGA